jgi:fused signal recognition particle receptor
VSSAEYLEIITGAIVVLAGGGAAVLVGRRRRSQPPQGQAERPTPGVDYAPGVGDDAEVPRDSATRTVESVDLPGDVPGDPVLVEEPPSAATAPAVEIPEPVAGRLARLRARLARSNNSLGQGLLALLSREHLDEETWEEIEETLLVADVGAGPTGELVDRLRRDVAVQGVRSPEAVRSMLRAELLEALDPAMDRSLAVHRVDGRPAVVLVVGVNGTGKTTTIGKLARVLVAQDKDVLLGAADTFRAAAADQLQTWGERVGVPTVRSDRDGADPAAVAFQAVKDGIEQEVDVVLVDTAGRLQNKVGLMDELGKVKRVIEKQAPVDEVLLVLDATTGQNGMQQAKVFSEVVDVTGIVLTKLDGTAKGGIVLAVQRALGVPVKLVGLGEGPDDLAPFEPEAFVDALLS